MSQLARDERALARKSEDRALHDMIKNLARPGYGRPASLFASGAPSQSLFAAPRYASTPLGGQRAAGSIQTPDSYYFGYFGDSYDGTPFNGTPNTPNRRRGKRGTNSDNNEHSMKNRRPRRRDPEREWNQRCNKIFQGVMRANASREFPHYARREQILQCKTIRLAPSIMPTSATPEDLVALFWQMGERLRHVEQLDISRTRHVTFDAVRAVLLTPIFGARLRILQAQEQPAIDDQVMQLLASRCSHSLRVVDFSKCPNLTDTGLKFLVQSANLEAIRLRACPMITGGTLRTLAGEATVGDGAVRLELLDVSACGRLHDMGFDSFAAAGASRSRIRRLTYLNLSDLSGTRAQNELSPDTIGMRKMPLTAARMARALVSHAHLKVLNLSNNETLVNDRTLKLIGERLPSISSLNVAKCRRITDAGLAAVSKGCEKLQAIHLAGLGKLTTHGIHALVHLRGATLVLLNLSGLQGTLPIDTIQPLAKRHLPFAEPAVTFYGFKPRDNVLYEKVRHQWKFIEAAAAANVQANIRGARSRAQVRLLKATMVQRIQRAWRCCSAKTTMARRRRRFALETAAAIFLQRNVRIVLWNWEKARSDKKQANLKRWLREMGAAATKIAALYRGYFLRENPASPVFDIVDEIRRREGRLRRRRFLDVVCKLQNTRRKRTQRIQRDLDAEEQAQRDRDCFLACRVLQQAIRMFNAKKKLWYLWQEWNANNMHLYNSGVMIQCMVREKLARKKLHRLRWQRRLEIMRQNQAASQIGAHMLRGPQSRASARLLHAKRHGAATTIQSWMRQRFVGHYSYFGVDELLQKWKGKMVWETLEAMQRAGQIMKNAEAGTDSASDSDEEWEPVPDPDGSGETIAYFSAKRNVRTEDPSKLRVFEKSLVHRKIMFFDENEQAWTKCAITAYNSWKNKHRVVYADKDGDYEWVNLRKNHHLCMLRQVNNDEGDYVMLRNLFPNRRAADEL
jgi:hypothetical protein